MTLQEMVRDIYGSYGNRFQIGQKKILSCLDIAQKAAFNHDCRAFVRTAILNDNGDFPEDAREIISAEGLDNYGVDFIHRRIISPIPNATVRYYLRPETLTGTEEADGMMEFSEGDEAKVIVPDEWRWQVLSQPAIALCDSKLYGSKSPQSYIETYFKEFWEAMSARPNDRKHISSIGAW